jgi:hypothetical protein
MKVDTRCIAGIEGLSTNEIKDLVAGWWGIPRGPIWTIAALATNVRGGRNVTGEVMWAMGLPLPRPVAAPELSPVEVVDRKHRRSMAIGAAWAIVALVFLGVTWVTYKAATAPPSTPNQVLPDGVPAESEVQTKPTAASMAPGSDGSAMQPELGKGAVFLAL